MSIFFEFEVGPTGRRFRRAIDDDVKDINSFITDEDRVLFGDVNIGSLIELSALSICMVNKNKDVTGFMALSDSPNIDGVDPAGWEFWIRNMYHGIENGGFVWPYRSHNIMVCDEEGNIRHLTIKSVYRRYFLPRNTLFIHFMGCRPEVSDIFLEEALVSVFRNDVYLLNIVLVVPPHCPNICFDKYHTFRKKNFYRYYSKPPSDTTEVIVAQYLCVATRLEICPRLRTRRAVEEDNDDLVELLNKKCSQLKELYGDYYISEIVGRHPDSNRQILVAEYQEQAVGCLCVNTDIDYKMLQNTYDLNTFYGLRAASVYEREKLKRDNVLLKTFGEPIMRGQWSPFSIMRKLSKTEVKIKGHRVEATSESSDQDEAVGKIMFKPNKVKDSVIYNIKRNSAESDPGTSPLPSLISFYSMLEADAFEYDIVNIDETLLVPPNLSLEQSSILKLPRVKTHVSEKSFHGNSRGRYASKQKAFDFVTPIPSIISKRSTMKISKWKNKRNRNIFTNLGGSPNAFIIELLALREDFDDAAYFDLLEAGFEALPNFEYCIIRTPCTESSFSLLQHFCYVPPRKHVHTNYALYVAHRSSVRGKLRVRKAEIIDVPQISQLLNTLDGKETMWSLENDLITEREHHVYVFLTGLSVVGVGILEPPEAVGYIRAKYNMYSYHYQNYHSMGAHIKNDFADVKRVLIHPAFEVHFRFFAREIMRLSGSFCLLWLTSYRNKWTIDKANSLASHMVPLIPRISEINCVPAKENKHILMFSSWFINKKITCMPKISIDVKLVIVGASRTTLGFLNALLFSDAASYLSFTSVTLISPNGMPYIRKSNTLYEMMFKKFTSSADKFLKRTPYTYYVNVVHGTMVEINKKEKYVRLKNDCKCYYDLLFMMFGKQYQYPFYNDALKSQLDPKLTSNNFSYTRLDVPRNNANETELVNIELPDNAFIINHISDAKKALNYISQLELLDERDNIVVYGGTIEAYCCLATLIEMKVPGKHITFVEAFPSENPYKSRISVFANEYVDDAVHKILKDQNITFYQSYYFKTWSVSLDNTVTQLELICYDRVIKVDCVAVFFYGCEGVDLNAFSAMCGSGMAYDGGVVVDANFRTKDTAIYAAGPITRYCRKYFAHKERHKHFDSYEVGEKLGTYIRNKLDPLFGDSTKKQENNYMDCIPTLKKPIVVHCTLPGSLQYLDVRSPGKGMPHHYLSTSNYTGYVIETFKGGYFKLHMNSNHVVDGITCLTNDITSLDNFKNLYGHSAITLKNVHLRYGTKRLNNLFTFFRSSWAFYLYHDNSAELMTMAAELLPTGQKNTMREHIKTIANKFIEDSTKTRTKIKNTFKKTPYVEAITDYIIQWLSENDELMPMYLQPWQVTDFKNDLAATKLFMKRTSLKYNMLNT